MKIQAKFSCSDNKLFFIENNSEYPVNGAVSVSSVEPGQAKADTLYAVNVTFSGVGKNEDSYNEEFLAAFRDWLKELEEKNSFAYIVPDSEGELEGSVKEDFVASMKHCARRIKDCENVIGFAVPSQADAEFFMEELSAKHKHYVFFSDNREFLEKNSNVCGICN